MANEMQYVQFLGGSRVEVRTGPVPEPAEGEALVQIAVSAICGSELPALRRESWAGQHHNPGHEMVGTVVQTNGICRVRAGQRVGVQVMSGCGRCLYCLQGDPKHCPNSMALLLDAHSEYVIAPDMFLVALPDVEQSVGLNLDQRVAQPCVIRPPDVALFRQPRVVPAQLSVCSHVWSLVMCSKRLHE